jgi:ribosome-associated protein
MGADNLAQFHQWRDWRRIARQVPIAVIARPGYDATGSRKSCDELAAARCAARRPGKEMDALEIAGLVLLRFRPDPTSATRIRAADPAWHRQYLRTRVRIPISSAVRAVSTAAHRRCCNPEELNWPLPPMCSASPAPMASRHCTHLVLASLDDDQAVETVSIPLAGKSSIADYMVVASGRSTRQVASMATKLAEKIKAEFGRSPRVEGLPTADWVLIDAGDVIVHLFRPEVRTFYNLERMWSFGETAGQA